MISLIWQAVLVAPLLFVVQKNIFVPKGHDNISIIDQPTAKTIFFVDLLLTSHLRVPINFWHSHPMPKSLKAYLQKEIRGSDFAIHWWWLGRQD